MVYAMMREYKHILYLYLSTCERPPQMLKTVPNSFIPLNMLIYAYNIV